MIIRSNMTLNDITADPLNIIFLKPLPKSFIFYFFIIREIQGLL